MGAVQFEQVEAGLGRAACGGDELAADRVQSSAVERVGRLVVGGVGDG